MPGSHIPILAPSVLKRDDLNYILILPWNIAPEVIEQNKGLLDYGTKFVKIVPDLKII